MEPSIGTQRKNSIAIGQPIISYFGALVVKL